MSDDTSDDELDWDPLEDDVDDVDPADDDAGLTEQVEEELPDQPSMAEPDGVVTRAVDEVVTAIASLTVTLLTGISRIVPFTERFWRGLFNAGCRGLHKKSGCDYLGFINVGGEIKPVPLDWDYEQQRFENRHDDWWKAPQEGEYEYRVAGRVPAVWASAASNHVGSHLQAEVAEVLDMGGGQPVFRNASVQHVTQILSAADAGDGDDQGPSQGQAVADGGQPNVLNSEIAVTDPGVFEDFVVPLGPENRIVSMEKYYETYPAVTDPEEMHMQEQRGRLAEQDRDYGKLALYMMLIAGGTIAAVELGPIVLNWILGMGGSAASDGGSVIPGMLTALGGI
jgi:hypothetical protein